MSPDRSQIRVELDMDELVASYVFATRRDQIDDGGAKGVWNGFGQFVVRVNDHPVLAVTLREDRQGRVVLETQQVDQHGAHGMPTIIELERDGKVPARTERKP